MSEHSDQHHRLRHALGNRLAWQQRLNDPDRLTGDRRTRLLALRRWQHGRLMGSFADLLDDPQTRPAAQFFLEDLYGDRDFSSRDRDLARLLPLMARLLPVRVLRAAVQAVELNVLSHAFDLRVADRLPVGSGGSPVIDADAYACAYRSAGCRRARRHQIDLIVAVGRDLDWAVHKHGVERLLRLSRTPARLAGLAELQSFLERGFTAFRQLGGADDFLNRIAEQEREVSRRLFEAHPAPFPPFDSGPNSSSR